MGYDIPILKVLNNFLTTLTQPSQDVVEQFSMNDSIFLKESQSSEKSDTSDDDAIKNMFGLQISNSSKGNSQSVEALSQRTEAAIANASSAL